MSYFKLCASLYVLPWQRESSMRLKERELQWGRQKRRQISPQSGNTGDTLRTKDSHVSVIRPFAM